MRKIFSSIGAWFILLSISPAFAFAQSIGNPCGTAGNSSATCNKTGTDLGKIVGAVVNLLFLAAGIVALIYLVLGGIKWITSEGDSKNVEGARNQIIAAAIGLAVTFLSYLVLNVLLRFLGVGDFSNLSIPNING